MNLVNVYEVVNPTISFQNPVKRLFGQFTKEEAIAMNARSKDDAPDTREGSKWKMFEPAPELTMIVDAGKVRHETSHVPHRNDVNLSVRVPLDQRVDIEPTNVKLPADQVITINGVPPNDEKVALVALLKANPNNQVVWNYKLPEEKASFGSGFALLGFEHPGLRPTTFSKAIQYVEKLRVMFDESQKKSLPNYSNAPPVAMRKLRNDFQKAKAAISREYEIWLAWIRDYNAAMAKGIVAPTMPGAEIRMCQLSAIAVAHELEAMLEKSVQRLLHKSEGEEGRKARETANALLRGEDPLGHKQKVATRTFTVSANMRCRNHAHSPAQSYMRK